MCVDIREYPVLLEAIHLAMMHGGVGTHVDLSHDANDFHHLHHCCIHVSLEHERVEHHDALPALHMSADDCGPNLEPLLCFKSRVGGFQDHGLAVVGDGGWHAHDNNVLDAHAAEHVHTHHANKPVVQADVLSA
jgi:hypothetical protein